MLGDSFFYGSRCKNRVHPEFDNFDRHIFVKIGLICYNIYILKERLMLILQKGVTGWQMWHMSGSQPWSRTKPGR